MMHFLAKSSIVAFAYFRFDTNWKFRIDSRHFTRGFSLLVYRGMSVAGVFSEVAYETAKHQTPSGSRKNMRKSNGRIKGQGSERSGRSANVDTGKSGIVGIRVSLCL